MLTASVFRVSCWTWKFHKRFPGPRWFSSSNGRSLCANSGHIASLGLWRIFLRINFPENVVRWPPRRCVGIRDPSGKYGDKRIQLYRFLFQHRLLQVVRWPMIAIGTPVMLDVKFRRVLGKTKFENQGRNTPPARTPFFSAQKIANLHTMDAQVSTIFEELSA
jgi:hypothetical protein